MMHGRGEKIFGTSDPWSFELRINGRERLVIGKGENGKLIAYSKLSFDIFLGRKLVQ